MILSISYLFSSQRVTARTDLTTDYLAIILNFIFFLKLNSIVSSFIIFCQIITKFCTSLRKISKFHAFFLHMVRDLTSLLIINMHRIMSVSSFWEHKFNLVLFIKIKTQIFYQVAFVNGYFEDYVGDILSL